MKINLVFSAILCFSTFAAFAAKPTSARQTVLEFFAAVDAGDFDKAGSYLSDDVMAYTPLSPQAMDKMSYKQLGMGMKAGFPDMQHKILDLSESAGAVAFKALFTGTNTASLQGNPPTGNRVSTPFLGFMKLDKKGKITEVNIQFNVASFNEQLMKGIDPSAMAKKIINDLFVVMDAGQTDKLGMYCAPGFLISNPFLPAPAPLEAFQGVIQAQKTAFPDMKHEVTEMVVEGSTVVTRGIFKGTNTGSMMGNPPTGNRVEIPFIVLDKLDGQGKLVSRFVQFDSKSFEAQLMKGINPGAAAEANIRGMLAAADAGDAEKFMSYWVGDGQNYFAGKLTSQEDMKKRIPAFKAAFPDIKRNLDEVIVNGNTVTVKGWVTGTNKGSFMGNKPTGNTIKVSWLGFYKLNAAGKVEAGWVEFDNEEFKNQVKGNSMGQK